LAVTGGTILCTVHVLPAKVEARVRNIVIIIIINNNKQHHSNMIILVILAALASIRQAAGQSGACSNVLWVLLTLILANLLLYSQLGL